MAKRKLGKYIGGGLLVAVVGGLGANYFTGGTLGDLADLVTPNAKVSDAEVDRIYEAARASLIAGYQDGSNEIAAAYPAWEAGSTAPRKPGVHSARYMMTYVNSVGFDTYVEYANADTEMPIGSVIAKESFLLKGAGTFRPSPLFTMEKVAISEAPETDGWIYGRVNSKGRQMPTGQKFCHACHVAYTGQDALGYPARDVRIGYTPPDPDAAPVEVSVGDVTRGEAAFQNCAACHAVGDGAGNGVGPALTGVVGRTAGTASGFNYSGSLKAAGGAGLVWDEQTLFDWLAGPSGFLKARLDDDGATSNMPIDFQDEQLRSDVIAFLKTQSGDN